MSEHPPKTSVPTCIFCLPCYAMAAMALSFEFLPSDALAIFGKRPPGGTLRISLAFAGAFLILGVVLHVIFYRLSPERFDIGTFRTAGIGMIVAVACLFGLSMALSRGTGLPPAILEERFGTAMVWIGAVILGSVVILFALLFAYLWISLKLHPGNRIGRRLAAGDFAGAIRTGEATPQEKRDFTTNLNLAMAYALAEETDKAKRLVADLEQTDGVPEYFTEETFKQTLKQLKEAIDRGPESKSSRA